MITCVDTLRGPPGEQHMDEPSQGCRTPLFVRVCGHVYLASPRPCHAHVHTRLRARVQRHASTRTHMPGRAHARAHAHAGSCEGIHVFIQGSTFRFVYPELGCDDLVKSEFKQDLADISDRIWEYIEDRKIEA